MLKFITGRCGTWIFDRRKLRLAALTGSFVRCKQRINQSRPSAGLQTQSQIGYPQQIVSSGHEIRPGLGPFHSAIVAAPQSAHRFHPAKDFLHPFANALAGAVTGATGRPSVQTINLGSIFACRVRCHFPLPTTTACGFSSPGCGAKPIAITRNLPTLPPASCSTCSKSLNQYLMSNPRFATHPSLTIPCHHHSNFVRVFQQTARGHF